MINYQSSSWISFVWIFNTYCPHTCHVADCHDNKHLFMASFLLFSLLLAQSINFTCQIVTVWLYKLSCMLHAQLFLQSQLTTQHSLSQPWEPMYDVTSNHIDQGVTPASIPSLLCKGNMYSFKFWVKCYDWVSLVSSDFWVSFYDGNSKPLALKPMFLVENLA
jgi:hypothetical protein